MSISDSFTCIGIRTKEVARVGVHQVRHTACSTVAFATRAFTGGAVFTGIGAIITAQITGAVVVVSAGIGGIIGTAASAGIGAIAVTSGAIIASVITGNVVGDIAGGDLGIELPAILAIALSARTAIYVGKEVGRKAAHASTWLVCKITHATGHVIQSVASTAGTSLDKILEVSDQVLIRVDLEGL